jgi:hypothetical protein
MVRRDDMHACREPETAAAQARGRCPALASGGKRNADYLELRECLEPAEVLDPRGRERPAGLGRARVRAVDEPFGSSDLVSHVHDPDWSCPPQGAGAEPARLHR